jgi:hypothetical protein
VEISDYLRTIGKRAWLLALIPALAGIVAAIVTIAQPAAFRTSATLQLPRDPNASPQQVAQQFVDFRAAANNNVTIERVADETGTVARKVRKVRIEQVGQSNFVTMTYVDRTRNPEQARAIMTALAQESLVTLNEAAIDRAQADLDGKQAAVEAVVAEVDGLQADLNEVYARVGTTQLADEQRTVRTQQASYEESAVQARAEGRNAEAQAYDVAAVGLQQRVDDLRFALAQETSLKPQLEDARARLRTAQAALATAEASVSSVRPQVDINFNAEGAPVRRKARTARLAGAAVLAGIPVAVALILLLDLVERRRKARGDLEDEDEDEEDEVEPEPEAEAHPESQPESEAIRRRVIAPAGSSGNGPVSEQTPAPAGNGLPAAGAGRPAGVSLRDERGSVGTAGRRGAAPVSTESASSPDAGRETGSMGSAAPATSTSSTTPATSTGSSGASTGASTRTSTGTSTGTSTSTADDAGIKESSDDATRASGRSRRSGPPRRG